MRGGSQRARDGPSGPVGSSADGVYRQLVSGPLHRVCNELSRTHVPLMSSQPWLCVPGLSQPLSKSHTAGEPGTHSPPSPLSPWEEVWARWASLGTELCQLRGGMMWAKGNRSFTFLNVHGLGCVSQWCAGTTLLAAWTPTKAFSSAGGLSESVFCSQGAVENSYSASLLMSPLFWLFLIVDLLLAVSQTMSQLKTQMRPRRSLAMSKPFHQICTLEDKPKLR